MENPKASVAAVLHLPNDVVLGEVLVSFVGRRCVLIENYRSILYYTNTVLKLQTKTCRLVITGSRLIIEYYTKEELKVTGWIQSVEFES